MKKIVFLTLLVSSLFINGMNAENKEEIIARYIVSITRYIEWPSNMRTGAFKIGVVGDFSTYKAIAEETIGLGIQHRNVDVINLSKVEDARITDFNMIILSGSLSDSENISKALQVIGNKPTLLVTEKEGALSFGSAINFIDLDTKIGFELNKKNVTKNGIQISRQIDVFANRIEN